MKSIWSIELLQSATRLNDHHDDVIALQKNRFVHSFISQQDYVVSMIIRSFRTVKRLAWSRFSSLKWIISNSKPWVTPISGIRTPEDTDRDLVHGMCIFIKVKSVTSKYCSFEKVMGTCWWFLKPYFRIVSAEPAPTDMDLFVNTDWTSAGNVSANMPMTLDSRRYEQFYTFMFTVFFRPL